MHNRLLRSISALLTFCILFLCSACQGAPSVLDPQGVGAAEIGRLSWTLIGLGTLIYAGVCLFLLLALFRRRNRNEVEPDIAQQPEGGQGIVLWGGMVMPAVVLLSVFGLTLNSLINLMSGEGDEAITINVIGHQWWWEVVYPNAGVVTANEIHVPVGQPVRINLAAEDVIHSFWIPQLHGKLDMIPGQTNTFTIHAQAAGEYHGLCAEFCGIQHAQMLFLVVAEPPEEFESWLAAQRLAAATPTDATAQRGQEVFVNSPCAQCHAIAGTTAGGRLGPDLTHFANRREIGAGILENNRSNLHRWLVQPQAVKPGNLMPATILPPDDLEALLDYLETLE